MRAARTAQAVLEIYGDGLDELVTPIDPVTIARELGINVYAAKMPNSVSGYIVKSDPGKAPDIFVNTEHAPVRQRFTIAHELGHYFHQIEKDGHEESTYSYRRDELSSCGTDTDERYANGFAAELLAPEPLIRQLKNDNKSELQIARELNVSLETIKYRMKNLGIVNEQ